MELILASGSPRRRELLSRLGLSFRVFTAHTEEVSKHQEPGEVARDLACQKAQAVAELAPEAVIIAADTVVALDRQLLGKPHDKNENARFLEMLSGKTHTVHTGVAVLSPAFQKSVVQATQVTFRTLTPAEVRWYAQSGEGLDKAGGYGIQELGLALVERVEGDYSNVVGFPMPRVIDLLRRAGVPVLQEPL
ncbi:Maf family protein [Deinococcus peraridilitoris]|uniref:dTTP/UTP pyrophosphatase n=1 Tax=Deinococcus peraridilitoris (strain DSM 19664 / LMG 22246 / CIP 109416 / KR-200) TaxID=937777 RepID=K9ZW46_DEIPD|nr:Maf family protein [Deinococcus peraridilitoris]AFZ65863.1 MAF protein [Deinococcus peraridilitoris DSM 19664]